MRVADARLAAASVVVTAATHAVNARVHPHDLHAGAPGERALAVAPDQSNRRHAKGQRSKGVWPKAIESVDDGDKLAPLSFETIEDRAAILAVKPLGRTRLVAGLGFLKPLPILSRRKHRVRKGA